MSARRYAAAIAAGVDQVTAYAQMVVAGELTATPDVARACERHLQDRRLRRPGSFDRLAAESAIARLGRLTRAERFVVGALFGWWCGSFNDRDTRRAYARVAATMPRLANRILTTYDGI